MGVAARTFDFDADFELVGDFLRATYRTSGSHVNWLQPRWEYMHFHPLIREIELSSIGIWQADGEIVGVAHPEFPMGRAYFEFAPGYEWLREEMLDHAEARISVQSEGMQSLRVYVNDLDTEFHELLEQRGYARDGSSDPMSHLPINGAVSVPPVPDGYRIADLATEDDPAKVHRALYRGFDHGDEPPDDGIEDRRLMQSAPNYDRALNIVAVASDGNYVSYGGTWYEPTNRVAYVEPVATDPDHRRRGLATAVVLEGVRRCAERGATVAYVGATLPLYRSLGFEECYRMSRWVREWPA